jgi:hypothetical protein
VMTNPTSPTQIVQSDGNRGFADSTWVYFSDGAGAGSNIYRAPVNGGARSLVGPGCCELVGGPSDVISHGTGTEPMGYSFIVYKTPKSGGSRTVVGYNPAVGYSLWGGLAVRGSDVYWLYGHDNGINLNKCPISGCPGVDGTNPTQIVPYTFVYGYQPNGLVVTSNTIYFATETGIYRIAR